MRRAAILRHLISSMMVGIILAGCGAVRSSPDDPMTAGGLTPSVKDRDLGLVAVAPGVDLKKYRVIVVEKFAVSATQIEDEGDRRFAEKMTGLLHTQLLRHLGESRLFEQVSDATAASPVPAGPRALRLGGTISRLGRGSQAARAFAGIYGAGRARLQADMHFTEEPSGRVMIAAADRRVSHGYQWFGGDDEELLQEAVGDMARDVAKFLMRLSKGEAPGP